MAFYGIPTFLATSFATAVFAEAFSLSFLGSGCVAGGVASVGFWSRTERRGVGSTNESSSDGQCG